MHSPFDLFGEGKAVFLSSPSEPLRVRLIGEKPAGFSLVQPTKFEFALNLRTARALGFQIPADVLALADEVIE
jgi:hypothetical protein